MPVRSERQVIPTLYKEVSIMYSRRIILLVSAMALLFGMSSAVAQDTEKKGDIAQIALITAKEGQGKALEAAIVEYHHFMATKPGSLRWQWYSVVTGKDTGKYLVRTGNHDWADFDAEHDWDDESDAKFASLITPHIASVAAGITRTDDKLGIWPDSMAGYKLFSVTRWYIKPGQYGAFMQGLTKIDTILKENKFPYPYAIIHNESGADGRLVSLVIPYMNYADMAPKEPGYMDVMNKVMGAEAAATFMADWGSSFKTGENFLLRYLPEQSDYGDAK